ncbi:hypothetical protein D9619_004684 [Psilocybe cf. subviscida]|uniref:BTB domain-containing protein n=1 Tax=Psilocybe cf. subviscida TaxID=2480587 RepID=A0A8H5BQJ1_9AGAR|nr:hypothetical protein D9619_004684 [Psilocybe cf. subviscida]
MQSSKHQDTYLLQPYPTPPAHFQDPGTSPSSFESESSSASLSMNPFSVLDMSYDGLVEEIWNPAPPIPLSSPDSEKSKSHSDLYSQATDLFSISTTFHTELVPAADALLFSSDGVFFWVHLETIHRHCPEAFQSFLNESSSHANSQIANPVMLDCPSEELNIILHALYDMSLDAYRPGADTVAAAIDLMPRLGVTVNRVVYPGCALYEYIISYTPLQPLEVYALAAHHDVHLLAVHASAYLLNMEILTVSEDASTRMGALYFLKLIRLHMTRFDALKASLLVAPPAHPPAMVDRCTFGQQQQARQVWALFCSEPLWHTRPSTLIVLLPSLFFKTDFAPTADSIALPSVDFAVQAMEGALHPMMEDLTCPECKATLRRMVARVRSQ